MIQMVKMVKTVCYYDVETSGYLLDGNIITITFNDDGEITTNSAKIITLNNTTLKVKDFLTNLDTGETNEYITIHIKQ